MKGNGKEIGRTCTGENNHHQDVLQRDPGRKLKKRCFYKCLPDFIDNSIIIQISFLLLFRSFPFEGLLFDWTAVSRALRYSLLSAGLLGQPPHDRNTNTRTTTDTNTRRTTNTNTSKAQPSSERNANTNTNSF